MRKGLAVSLAILLLYVPLFTRNSAAATIPQQDQQDQQPPQDQQQPQDQQDQQPQDQGQQPQAYQPYTADQLDNLLAPIALYPDPLLAQVLPAATFPDQIDEAARYVRSYGQNGVDGQPWDVSVKSVAHYPAVIDMMDSKLDWTTAVGQAYVNQSTDVMSSVQRLRAMARSQGNLVSTPQQQVVYNGGYIQIYPAQPQYIYVPVYNPSIVYFQRPSWGLAIGFGVGFAIGSWLNYDCDWGGGRVYYAGWNDRGWRRRSRNYVQINNTYINNTYRNVTINKTVINRTVNVRNINNYKSVHRNVTYNNIARNNVVAARKTNARLISPAARPNNRTNNAAINRNINNPKNRVNNAAINRNINNPKNRVNNAVINRNINTNDAKLNQYRGRPAPAAAKARPASKQAARPAFTPPNRAAQPSNARTQPRPAFVPPNRPYQPAGRAAPQGRAQAQPRPQYQPSPHAFGRSETNFNPRAAAQRGQASRAQAARPPVRSQYRPPAPRQQQQIRAPAPRQQSRAPARPQGRPAPGRPHGGKP